jgi:hypothetical protein
MYRCLVIALLAVACHPPRILPSDTGEPVDTGEPDLSDRVYDPDRLLRVEIEIDPGDWDALRVETRDGWDMLAGEDCLSEPWDDPISSGSSPPCRAPRR